MGNFLLGAIVALGILVVLNPELIHCPITDLSDCIKAGQKD